MVINIASKEADLKIDQVHARGDVLLLAGETTDTSASILNVAKDDTVANIQGEAISLIASNTIGTSDKSVTFNQTNTDKEVDFLSIKDMYLKGLDDAYDTNAGTIISREGSANIEFSGNTIIDEITAAKDINVVTRGAALQIHKLGSVPETPVDYYGPNADITPENATIKALDINTRTRLDNTMIDGVNHWADSRVVINEGRLQKGGTLNVVADRVYANGVQSKINKDGFSKIENDATKPFEGEDLTLTHKAVRPDDVTDIGHDKDERNYYYPEGDGDFTDGSTNVDPDDGVVDATPLEIEGKDPGPDQPDPPGPDQPDPPGPVDPDEPDPPGPVDPDDPDRPNPPVDPDDPNGPIDPNPDDPSPLGYQYLYKQRTMEHNIGAMDKRQTMRFNVNSNNIPLSLAPNDQVASVVDISRGGVAVTHNETLKVGDVVPVQITYGDVQINTDIKVVSATKNRAGAEFVNLDEATANNILYMNILIEDSIAQAKLQKQHQMEMQAAQELEQQIDSVARPFDIENDNLSLIK